jgi:hypothetical protein
MITRGSCLFKQISTAPPYSRVFSIAIKVSLEELGPSVEHSCQKQNIWTHADCESKQGLRCIEISHQILAALAVQRR